MKNSNKKYYQTLLLIIFLLTAYSLQLNTTVRFVSKTGLSIPPYITWETAADSIQKCINISVFGDTIYVANGVYEEQVVMIPGLSLIGAGSDSCIINTQALVNAIGFVAVEVKDSCLFKGFKIEVYYNNDKGFGIAQSSNSLVTNNRITSAGVGIYIGWTGISKPIAYQNSIDNVQMGFWIYNSSPLVKCNLIYPTDNNAATMIMGIFIEADIINYKPIIDSNYIVAGIRCDGIYKNPGTRTTIRNNTIILDHGADGIFLHSYVSDSAWVYNNLIIAESAACGIYTNGSNYLQISNNYIIGHFGYGLSIGPNHKVKNNVITGANGGVEVWGTQNLVFEFNNVWNNQENYYGFTPDTTNLSIDPMIVNDDTTQGEVDFHLQKYSPLIDTATQTFWIKMEQEATSVFTEGLMVKVISIRTLHQNLREDFLQLLIPV